MIMPKLKEKRTKAYRREEQWVRNGQVVKSKSDQWDTTVHVNPNPAKGSTRKKVRTELFKPPRTISDPDGDIYMLVAATKHGVPFDDMQHHIDVLSRAGYDVRLMNNPDGIGQPNKDYFLYAKKKKTWRLGFRKVSTANLNKMSKDQLKNRMKDLKWNEVAYDLRSENFAKKKKEHYLRQSSVAKREYEKASRVLRGKQIAKMSDNALRGKVEEITKRMEEIDKKRRVAHQKKQLIREKRQIGILKKLRVQRKQYKTALNERVIAGRWKHVFTHKYRRDGVTSYEHTLVGWKDPKKMLSLTVRPASDFKPASDSSYYNVIVPPDSTRYGINTLYIRVKAKNRPDAWRKFWKALQKDPELLRKGVQEI